MRDMSDAERKKLSHRGTKPNNNLRLPDKPHAPPTVGSGDLLGGSQRNKNMNITFDKLTLEINREEAYTLYSTIYHGLEDRILDHWKNHPDAFDKLESSRLQMMRELARFTGNDFIYDSAQLKKLIADNQPKPKAA